MIQIKPHTQCYPKFEKFDETIPKAFQALKKFILSKIKNVKIEHFGSSSVGIGGKNVVDVLVICPNQDYKAVLAQLNNMGFQEPTDYTPPPERPMRVAEFGYDDKIYHLHLHITYDVSKVHTDAIKFRDYLKAHPDAAKKYEMLKKNELETSISERDKYNLPKKEFISQILSK